LPMNLERIANMIEITKRLGKTFLMEEKIAAFWFDAIQNGVEELKGHSSITDMETIKVLESYNRNADLPYERINIEDVIDDKSNYIIHLNYVSLPYLIEFEQLGDQTENSIIIHANAPVHQNNLQKWLSEFQIDYHNISNSGHASHQDISNLIEQIDPRVVIPVHGKRPDLLESRGVPKYLPNYSKKISIENLLMNEQQIKGV